MGTNSVLKLLQGDSQDEFTLSIFERMQAGTVFLRQAILSLIYKTEQAILL